MAMENPPFMDDVPIKNLQFISIHRRFPIAMFDYRPQSVIDNTTSKPAAGLSVPPLPTLPLLVVFRMRSCSPGVIVF